MKKILITLFALSLIFGLQQCGKKAEPAKSTISSKFDFLIGKWKILKRQKESYEVWSKTNHDELYGYCYELDAGDSNETEKIQLTKCGDSICYIPTLPTHNDGRPMVFSMTEANDTIFIFENQKNDFPQRIIYQIIHPDTMNVWIDGTPGGYSEDKTNFKKIDFLYIRYKEEDSTRKTSKKSATDDNLDELELLPLAAPKQ